MSITHDTRGLHGIDLNLLVAFDALARERNVTRAAKQAGVTQSAMSHTLRRLRELFDDPLFVRARGGVALTPRAESLVLPLRAGLVSLVRALEQPGGFDPATARRVFRIVTPDLFDVLVLPRLLRRLSVEAPGVDIAVAPAPEQLSDALETGEVDLAISPVLLDSEGFDVGRPPAGHMRRRTLFRDTVRCFARVGHAQVAAGRALSLATYTALPHLLVSPTGVGPGLVDRYLGQVGESRRVALRVPTFSAALTIVAESDLLLTAPSALAQAAPEGRVQSVAVPLELPEHSITMLWHPRFGEDPANRWFWEVLVGVSAGLGAQ